MDIRWSTKGMNSWKNKTSIKFLAWILSIFSAAVFIMSAAVATIAADQGIYDKRESEVNARLEEKIDKIYATMAMANRGTDFAESMKETGFRYGIVKADHIDRVDLSDEKNYVDTNFETFPTANALKESKEWKVLHYYIGDHTTYEWYQSIFGYAYYYNNGDFREIDSNFEYSDEEYNAADQEKTYIQVPIQGRVYDIDNGIFFYKTEDGYFRINTVALPVSVDGDYVDFQYDSSQGAYYNQEKDRCLIPEYYLTLNAFDSTDHGWESWNEIVLDGQSFSHMDIDFVREDEIGEIATMYYDSASADTLTYLGEEPNTDEDENYFHYWVVYRVEEPVISSMFWTGDLYQQAVSTVHFLYELKYNLIICMVVSGILWLISTVIVLTMAGHIRVKIEPEPGEKKAKYADKVQEGFLQVLPFDIFTAVLFGLVMAAAFGAYAMIDIGLSVHGIVMAMFMLMLAYLIGLIWLADFAVRIKLGKWWRNTLVYKILAGIGRAIKKLFRKVFRFAEENISLLGKTALVVGAVSLLEFIVIVLTRHNVEVEILFWIFGRILLVVCIVLLLRQAGKLKEAGEKMARGQLNEKVDTKNLLWEFKKHGENLNQIVDGMNCALEERMKSERFKTELITNVSHDIKTPLTSIINYVDLLGKEEIENEKAQEYLDVLSRQSSRLKKLIEDLIEASKASTGNLPVNKQQMEMGVFLMQMLGEYEEKLKKSDITVLLTKPEEDVMVSSDGRHLSRVMDNLLNNICKYAYPGTRAFIDLKKTETGCIISVKNTSKYPINMKGEDLMERFARGDASRHTEGSGLGLSIAVSLMDLMGGSLRIETDGDLFKAILEL